MSSIVVPLSYNDYLFPNKQLSRKAHVPQIVSNNLSVALHPTPRLDAGGFAMTVDDIRAKAEPVATMLAKEQEDRLKVQKSLELNHHEREHENINQYFENENMKRRQEARDAYMQKAKADLKRAGHNVPDAEVEKKVEDRLVDKSVGSTLENPPVTDTQLKAGDIIQETQGDGLMGQGMNLNTLLGGFPASPADVTPEFNLPPFTDVNRTLPTAHEALFAQTQSNGGLAPVRNADELASDIFDTLLKPSSSAAKAGAVQQALSQVTVPAGVATGLAQGGSAVDLRPVPAVGGASIALGVGPRKSGRVTKQPARYGASPEKKNN
jgi:hypothetical protein